ncbi:MAG: hypothetical protein HOV81_43055 [Kofleriaceae bacterium]|nr:hypothetical protein [Kofleriaceae bacterium]
MPRDSCTGVLSLSFAHPDCSRTWQNPVEVFVKRSSVFGAALASLVLIGCEAGSPHSAFHLGSLPEGDPAELEPGYASVPPNWRSRIVPACRVNEPGDNTSPAIEIQSSGDGGSTGNMQIWEDGTVLFDGAGCPNESRRRGKMSPARVRAVIDMLEGAHFFMWPCKVEVRCYDSFITSITVRRGRAANTLVDTGCSSEPTFAAQAIELVTKAVGKNACDSSCRETPAPAYCH